ncbi:MAG TPA: pilus assembly protein PilM [Thermoleophilaceae bacterium]|nr:pilus assembly protein PilM [Thermoleophilaceae bacterium]
MPLKFFQPKSHTHVGLHIDSLRASAVAVDRKRVVSAASVELPPGAVTDVGVPEPGQLAESLRELFARGGFGRRVYLGLSVRNGVVRLLDMPLIDDDAQRDSAVRFQAAEAIAMPLEEAILDYAVVGQSVQPPAPPRMHVVLAAARRAPVQEFVEAVQAAGLRPQGIELEPFALVRVLGEPAAEGEPARLYVHVGAANAVLAIAVGHACMFTRSAPSSGAGLAEHIRMLLGYHASQPGMREVTEVIVSGAGSDGNVSLDALGVPDGIPVRFASPFGSLEVGSSSEDDQRHLTLATGIALGAFA